MLKKVFKPIIIVCGLFLCLTSANKITLHTIGDSTMATYDETSNKKGWGQMFGQFFRADSVVVNNRAKSGASTKSFYNEEAYWVTVKPKIKAGDYVFIQFAHNDEKCDGMDGDEWNATHPENLYTDVRGTSPFGTYQDYLRKYIDESRACGATPILVTPIVRRYFGSDGKITNKGRHNLKEGNDHSLDYVAAMKAVAVEKEVALIDHTEMTSKFIEDLGVELSASLIYSSGDNTHTSATGAVFYARLVAQEMHRQGILSQYIQDDASLIVNPTALDFGRSYPNNVKTLECSLLGMSLQPTQGTITLRLQPPFSISSTPDGDAGQECILNYSNGNMPMTNVYIHCNALESGIYYDTLSISNNYITQSVPLTVNCVNLSNGEKVSLQWDLSANDNYQLNGPATALPETWSKMKIQNYAEPKSGATTWPEGSNLASIKTQRNVIEGENWPAGEIDAVSDRYVQFGIQANNDTKLTIDSIGLYAGGAGGNGMRFRIEYSIKQNFAEETVISERLNNTSNTMYAIQSMPLVQLNAGEQLLLRIYPWYSGAATGKTICLSKVYIGGLAQKATPLTAIEKENSLCYREGILLNPLNENIQLYDQSGRWLMSTTNNIDFRELPRGFYLVRGISFIKKIVW